MNEFDSLIDRQIRPILIIESSTSTSKELTITLRYLIQHCYRKVKSIFSASRLLCCKRFKTLTCDKWDEKNIILYLLSTCLSVCLSVCLSLSFSLFLLFVRLAVSLFVYLSVFLPLSLSFYLSGCLSVTAYVSACLSSLSTSSPPPSLSLSLSLSLFIVHVVLDLSVCQSLLHAITRLSPL